jgi:hypothetical protein
MNNNSMDSGLIPLKMCSAVVMLDQYQPGWTLAQIEPGEISGRRSFEYYIHFDQSFSNVPLVHCGISGFDIDNQDTIRLSVSIAKITSDGFKIVIQTWLHTCVYGVEISWIALGNA